MTVGTVHLVGAGPGDPGLLTLRGRDRLAAADVVVYDRLVAAELLGHARPDAELIYVGKSPQGHTLTQDEINQLLVAKALDGKRVCRLKGGDPFVFGRGAEEILALVDHAIPFEVVPGVTSAVAAPAYAGIPITHRGVAASVAIVTGHETPEKAAAQLDWPRIATATDTLVFLMGAGHLQEIAVALIAHGRPADTPAAVVEWGTRPRQRTAEGTLDTIARRAQEAGLGSPAVIVVGHVAALRQSLRWFDARPLFGLRMLVLRTREQASELSCLLEEHGAVAIEVPVIRITDPDDFGPLDTALAQVASFDWLLFTSANGVRAVRDRLAALRWDVRALKGPSLAAIGAKTAEALESMGLRVEIVPDEYVAEALAQRLGHEQLPGKRVLILRAQEAREALVDALLAMGAKVSVAPCYKTVPATENADTIRRLLNDREVDAVTFTSSSMVRSFADCFAGQDLGDLLSEVTVACIGPITSRAAAELGIRVDVQPEEYTVRALAEALVEGRSATAAAIGK